LTCQDMFARLSEYLDGELPGDLRAEMQAHIEDCAPCGEFVQSFRKSIDLCREAKQTAGRPQVPSQECIEALRAVYLEKVRQRSA
jgi:anti-sigma factor RsiW